MYSFSQDPALTSAISTLEESQIQPSPSKKPAIDDNCTNHATSSVKSLSKSSPRTSGKKPVLPPPGPKVKLDITGAINKEQASPSAKVKGDPPAPPPKVHKDEKSGVGEAKDTNSSPLKEATIERMDTTDSSSPSAKVKGDPPAPPPKVYKEEESGVCEAKGTSGPLLKEATSEIIDTIDSVKGDPVVPPLKVCKEEKSDTRKAKDTSTPPLEEATKVIMDTTDNNLPVLSPTKSTGTAPLTKPKPSREKEGKVMDVSLPITSPKEEIENKLVDTTNNGLSSSPPATPTSTGSMPTNDMATSTTNAAITTSNVSLTKPDKPPIGNMDANAPVSSLAGDGSSKAFNTEESIKSLDVNANGVNGTAASSAAIGTDNGLPTSVKSPDTVENNVLTTSTTVPTTIPSRPFAKPRPPGKHPKPKSTPSRDRNLGLFVAEATDNISNGKETSGQEVKQVATDKISNGKETSNNSGQEAERVATDKISNSKETLDKSGREAKQVKDNVETSMEDSAIKEPTGENVVTKGKIATEQGKEKEEVVMRQTGPDKVGMVPRPKPKPRTSKIDFPKPPLTNPIPAPAVNAVQKNTAVENNNEKVEQKSDAETVKKAENVSSPTVENKNDKINDAVESAEDKQVEDKDKQINTGVQLDTDEKMDTIATYENKTFTIEDDGVDALYSVVDLNRNGEERELTNAKSPKEITPRLHHNYDLVAISPSPEQEEPCYDEIGEVVKKEPSPAKEATYDNWKLKKQPQTESSKAKDETNGGLNYAVVQHKAKNYPLTDAPQSVAPSTVPQYARINKSGKTKNPEASSHVDSGTMDDKDFDALCERIGSSIPAHLDQAKELVRLAHVARQEAKQLKKEAAEDREAARRERIEAERLKRNASEILKTAEEKVASTT